MAAVVTALPAVALAAGASPLHAGALAPTCAHASSAHHAALVVEHGDGSVLTFCDGFDTATLNGEQLLKDSGIEFRVVHYSFGDAVCQIDGEPNSFPPSCFSSSTPYWAIFTAAAGAPWSSSTSGVSGVSLGDGGAEGFRYDPQGGTPAPPPAPGGVCQAAPTPPPATPTPTAAPTPFASPIPTAPTPLTVFLPPPPPRASAPSPGNGSPTDAAAPVTSATPRAAPSPTEATASAPSTPPGGVAALSTLGDGPAPSVRRSPSVATVGGGGSPQLTVLGAAAAGVAAVVLAVLLVIGARRRSAG